VEHVVDVRLGCLEADDQLFRDLTIAVAARHEDGNLALSF